MKRDTHFNKKIRFRIDMHRKKGWIEKRELFKEAKSLQRIKTCCDTASMRFFGRLLLRSLLTLYLRHSFILFLSFFSLFSFFFFWKILCRYSSSCCPRNRWLYCITFLLQHGYGEVMCISRTRYIQAVLQLFECVCLCMNTQCSKTG